ncbi:MAG: DUF445 family protein [Desulfobacterales bacterium]|nr:DUF445 family protein [Desulfobacterales bacterium]MBF0397259.1 DUF445 family protein [Desulfobacterales bacterium]
MLDMLTSSIFWEKVIAFLTSHDLWVIYIGIPAINAIIGWGTNEQAIYMMFYPLDPIGKPPLLGWQGIVPAKIEKMAGMAVDIITSKLINIKEVFDRVDPKRVAEELEAPVVTLLEPLVNETMQEFAPSIWESLPQTVKDRIIGRCAQDSPQVVRNIMEDMKTRVEDIFDLRDMVIKALKRDRELMNNMFLKIGAKEFKFVGISGLYFGYLFGFFQMLIWLFVQPWWLLPVGGAIVGYATNWLALKMVFEPRTPQKYFIFFTWQGLFFRRQKEVAAEYGKMVASKILNPPNIVEAILRGPGSDELFRIIQLHINKAIEKQFGIVKPVTQFVIGTKEYIEMKQKICDRIIEDLPKSTKYVYNYGKEALDIENTLKEKLGSLSHEDFEGILRPVFQEDEWKLIAVGAVLGCVAGCIQILLM